MLQKWKQKIQGLHYIGVLLCMCMFVVCTSMQVKANTQLQAVYSAFFAAEGAKAGWSAEIQDNTKLYVQGNYPSALRIGLVGQPEGMSGTVVYQVNLSGSGWLPAVENRAETGAADLGQQPLESVKVWLNGDLANHYDIYYRVLQNGAFTPWVKNGEEAGSHGVGTRIEGLVFAIRGKDAGEPGESLELPADKPAASQGTGTRNIDPSKPMIALTYDDGPHTAHTSRILDILDAHGAKATFYVIGQEVGKGANLLQRMAAGGHEIGNHTWAHQNLTKQSAAQRKEALHMTAAAIEQAAGIRPTTMRAPYGALDEKVKESIGSLGYPSILWSIDTLDWKHKNAQTTVDTVLSQVKDGDIILMHDVYGATADASAVLIPELIGRGYQLVTVSEMASLRGGMQAGSNYRRFR